MKALVVTFTLIMVAAWIALVALLLGYLPASWLPLSLPKSASDFGEAFGVINSLFSSLAVVLALVAVLLQGNELKASTKAQEEQTDALQQQLAQQQKLMRIQLLQAEAQYRSAEVQRMDSIIERITGNSDKKTLFQNTVNMKKKHTDALKNIGATLDQER